MIQAQFKEAAFECAREASALESVKQVVLFGSVARGEGGKKSDLDFLIITTGVKEKAQLNEIVNRVSKKHNVSIQTVLTNSRFSGLDHNFVENVVREGLTLYGKSLRIEANSLKLEPFVLFNYETKGSLVKERNTLGRILYGYHTEKKYKGKKYASASEGLVKKYGGWKAGLAAIIVSAREAKVFEKVLKENKAKYNKLEVWIPKI